MEINFEPTFTGTYAEGLIQKLTDFGFDSWDIKGADIEYIFGNKKFRILHDFLQKYLQHDHVLTDAELICYKDIASIMLDKAKSDQLIAKMRKEDHAQTEFSDEIFTFDSFSDDDNLLALDEIDNMTNDTKTKGNKGGLDMIEEEFDNYEEALKQIDHYDLDAMQVKLGIELARSEIEDRLGINTEDTMKQQLISMESEIKILDNEEKLLLMELENLETENEKNEAILENKETQ